MRYLVSTFCSLCLVPTLRHGNAFIDVSRPENSKIQLFLSLGLIYYLSRSDRRCIPTPERGNEIIQPHSHAGAWKRDNPITFLRRRVETKESGLISTPEHGNEVFWSHFHAGAWKRGFLVSFPRRSMGTRSSGLVPTLRRGNAFFDVSRPENSKIQLFLRSGLIYYLSRSDRRCISTPEHGNEVFWSRSYAPAWECLLRRFTS